MRDHTIDEALVELARTMKALKALRAARKALTVRPVGELVAGWGVDPKCRKQHAAAKRASLDLTRKLADLRAER
jgi:hypothetical protein